MRRSYGTVLGLAIGIVAWSVGLAFAQQPGPGPTRLPQEGSEAPTEAATPVKKAPADVEKLLDATRVKVEFFETPLKDVCGYFSEILNIDVLIDKQGLEPLGIVEDSPVTIHIHKSEISVRTVLELLLRQLSPECVAMPKDGLLLITSEQNSYITESYDLAELFGVDLRDPRSRIDITEATNLLQLIKTKVAPDSWMEVGGRGSIDIFRTSLIVKNSPKVQHEIRDVLKMLPPKQQAVALPALAPLPMSERRPAALPERAPTPDVEPMRTPAEPARPEAPPPASPGDRIRTAAAKLIEGMDANKDGKLQKDELGKWKAFYEGADTNGDETLTLDEIIPHMTKLLAEPPKPLKPAVPNALPPPLPPPTSAPESP